MDMQVGEEKKWLNPLKALALLERQTGRISQKAVP